MAQDPPQMPPTPSKDHDPIFTTGEMDSVERGLPPAAPLLIVGVILAIVLGAYFYIARPRAGAEAAITKVNVEEQANSGRCIVGIEMRIKNVSDKAFWIRSVEVKTTTPQGEFTDNPAPGGDMPRYFSAFPSLTSDKPPLVENVKIQPGQTQEGYVIVGFATSKDDFSKRKSLEVHIEIYDRSPLVIREKPAS